MLLKTEGITTGGTYRSGMKNHFEMSSTVLTERRVSETGFKLSFKFI